MRETPYEVPAHTCPLSSNTKLRMQLFVIPVTRKTDESAGVVPKSPFCVPIHSLPSWSLSMQLYLLLYRSISLAWGKEVSVSVFVLSMNMPFCV